MSIVTDIKQQKGNKNRISLYLDNRFCCGLEAITALKYSIKIGDELCEERLKEIQIESESTTAFDKALKKITGRIQTKRQIRQFLTEKGYFSEVADIVIEKLERYNYIDDLAYARIYINSCKEKKGICRLRMELRDAGVDNDSLDEALSTLDNQSEQAYQCAAKYLRTREFNRQKVYGHLMYKGFRSEDIMVALERIKREEKENKHD